MKTSVLAAITLACVLLQAPCSATQDNADFLSTPEGRRLAESRFSKLCEPESPFVAVYQALTPALQEELLTNRLEPTQEEFRAGQRSLSDLVINELWVKPGSPARVLCSPDNRHIVQVYDNESGAISLHCIVYNRLDNGLWKQGKEFSFMTRYASFGAVELAPDGAGLKVEFIDKELGLTIPEHVSYQTGPEIITYRAQHESDRNDSVLTPLTSEVGENNLSHVWTFIRARKVNMRQTDAYGRNAVWYAHTPEMQQLLTTTDPAEEEKAVDQGSQVDDNYVRDFLRTEDGPAFQVHLAPYGWDGMETAKQRTCIERFRMLPPSLQKELLEEPAGMAEYSLTALLVNVLANLELKWYNHMLFPEEGGRIAIQSGHDHSISRSLTVYTRNNKGEWHRTTTFTMETGHATLSDFSLQADGADITVADPDFGIGFTEHFKYTEVDPVHRYRATNRSQSLNTALNEEVKHDNLHHVHLMLESGKVNPNDRDINGDTALDCACSARMVELLKARGATKRGRH